MSRGQWLVSTAGGVQPLWSRDGRELFYRALDGALMSVHVGPGTTWAASTPMKLLDAPLVLFAGLDGGGTTRAGTMSRLTVDAF